MATASETRLKRLFEAGMAPGGFEFVIRSKCWQED